MKGKPRGRNGGRKPTNAAPMAKIPVTIRRDQADWLAGKNRSQQVRDALDLLMAEEVENSLPDIPGGD